MTLCYCVSGFCCFKGSKCFHLQASNSPKLKWTRLLGPWRWRHYNPLKHWKPLSQWHVMSRKTTVLKQHHCEKLKYHMHFTVWTVYTSICHQQRVLQLWFCVDKNLPAPITVECANHHSVHSHIQSVWYPTRIMPLIILKWFSMLIRHHSLLSVSEHNPPHSATQQGITATFKCYYTWRTFSYTLDGIEDKDSFNVQEFWKSFNVADCTTMVVDSVDELRPPTLNSCWLKVWEEVVKDSKESLKLVRRSTAKLTFGASPDSH